MVNSSPIPPHKLTELAVNIEAFLTTLTHDEDGNTRLAYRTALKAFLATRIPLDDNVFRAFDRWLATHTYQPKGQTAQQQSGKRTLRPHPRKAYAETTRRLYVAALRRFVDYLIAEDLLDDIDVGKAESKLRSLRSRRGAPPYQRPQVSAQLSRLIAYYDELAPPDPDQPDAARLNLELLRNRALMHTLYATGGRVSEVLKIQRAQVDDGRWDEAAVKGKGNKDRDLLFTPEAMKAIQVYCRARGGDPYPAVFISHRRGLGQPLTRVSGWSIVKRAALALGIEAASPHKFRHYRGQQLLNEGMPLDMVQAYLGHASPETTRRIYAPTDKAVLKDQLKTYGLSPKDAEEGASRRAGKPR